MKEFAELVNAIASLAWPVFAAIVFFHIKDDIKELIGRLKKGKFLGQEIELRDELKDLSTTVEAVKMSTTGTNIEDKLQNNLAITRNEINNSQQQPLQIFLTLASKLEMAVNNILARTGWGKGNRFMSLQQAFSHLPKDWLANDIATSVRKFTKIRNKIIHQYHEVSENEVLTAIDIAFELLNILQSYPVEENRVVDLIPAYRDPECTNKFVGISALRLRTRNNNMEDFIRLFPTSENWYEPGQLVSWDWNSSKIHGKAWYIDPDTHEKKEAWQGSMEFCGYPITEISITDSVSM